jgi:putative transposase
MHAPSIRKLFGYYEPIQKGEKQMLKAYKYRLYPNKITEQKLYGILNRCRELYNAALSERKDAYQQYQRTTVIARQERTVVATMIAGHQIKSISFYGQKRDLVEIKQDRPEYQDIASHVLQDVLNRLDKAFAAFFRRIRNGETPGYPRFKGRNRYDSFTYPDRAGWEFDGWHLHLSKIGSIKVKLHRKIEGKIKTCTIKREVDQWYVVFSCEVEATAQLPVSYEDVGIDLGVTRLATLSNGEMIEHPRYYRKAQKTLEKRQQALSRKKKDSHRRERSKKLIGKAHRKIARQRCDFLHKQSRKLVERYQVLVFEDIQVGNLTRKPKPKQDENGAYLPNGAAAKGGLNKSILDAGWGAFVSMCTSKAAEAGRTLVKVNPQFTSQVCSGCGQVREKDLSERWHSCDCGAELDRDVNAAINILARGKQQLARKEPTRATA